MAKKRARIDEYLRVRSADGRVVKFEAGSGKVYFWHSALALEEGQFYRVTGELSRSEFGGEVFEVLQSVEVFNVIPL